MIFQCSTSYLTMHKVHMHAGAIRQLLYGCAYIREIIHSLSSWIIFPYIRTNHTITYTYWCGIISLISQCLTSNISQMQILYGFAYTKARRLSSRTDATYTCKCCRVLNPYGNPFYTKIHDCTQDCRWISILKPTANWSPYIFTLVQKVKHRVYTIHVFKCSNTLPRLCKLFHLK